MTTLAKNTAALITRPPVVAVLGHIDHGKTTLLDFIRKSTVAAKESGGITQHIGAYEIEIPQEPKSRESEAKRGIPRQARDDFAAHRKITFLDTPGHEAFAKMRARGAHVADIALLVVAADEGVKPQTLEALEQIKISGTTLIIVINKIDKPDAKPERVKQQLAEKGLLLEGWGGNVPNQEVSAKTGKGVPDLLSLILLVAELAELKADPSAPAEGVVIEAHKDTRVGNVATLLIKNGTLRKGDFVVAGKAIAKTKNIALADGTPVAEAESSAPIVIFGFKELPGVGDAFRATVHQKEAETAARAFEKEKEYSSTPSADADQKPILNVVLKTDVTGTKEALEKIIGDLNFEKAGARVVKSDVGDINEGDVTFAESTKALLAVFKVRISPPAAKLIQARSVPVVSAHVVYELADAIKEKVRELLPPDITRRDVGKIQILATFKMEKSKMIVGGKVMEGKVKKGSKADVKRKGTILFSGKITQLQHLKKDTDAVEVGRECGMMFVPAAPQEKQIEKGDELFVYEEEIALKSLE